MLSIIFWTSWRNFLLFNISKWRRGRNDYHTVTHWFYLLRLTYTTQECKSMPKVLCPRLLNMLKINWVINNYNHYMHLNKYYSGEYFKKTKRYKRLFYTFLTQVANLYYVDVKIVQTGGITMVSMLKSSWKINDCYLYLSIIFLLHSIWKWRTGSNSYYTLVSTWSD